MDDDAGPSRSTRPTTALLILSLILAVLLFAAPLGGTALSAEAVSPESAGGASSLALDSDNEPSPPLPQTAGLSMPIIAAMVVLLVLSAFFSGSETAFLSLDELRLRALREEGRYTGRLVARMMDAPARLLTTILVGNMIVNVLIGVVLGARVEHVFMAAGMPGPAAYGLAVVLCTSVLVFFGEVSPKVLAVYAGERFARLTVLPLLAADWVIAPVRKAMLWLTNGIFRITRFHELRAAPFMTDDEFKSVLSDGESQGVIEEGERQMIQGILEFSETLLREILTPRPDVTALAADATLAEALEVYREHEYSRMPVYEGDIDHVVGILVMKDLLGSITKGETNRSVGEFLRPPHFVPETMTVLQFVHTAQKRRSHLAVVVDEYGGTAGTVTLEDAIEEVVGDILDEGEQEEPGYVAVSPGVYRVDGGYPLDELNENLGIYLEDEEHETVAGFLMHRTEKVPEPGDRIEHPAAHFEVESCDGKRVVAVRVELLKRPVVDSKNGEEGS